MEMNGLMGGFYKFSIIITRFALTNIIWLLFNLPILYFILTIVGSEFKNVQMGGLIIACLAPFIFFPATSAMYGVIRKWVMGEADIPILKSYLQYYKENYKRSVLGGIVFTLIWSSLFLNYFLFVHEQSLIVMIIFVILAAFFFTWNAYYFSYVVHFEMRFMTSLKNAFILTISHPFSTAGVALISGGLIYLSSSLTFLLPLCIGTVSAYFSFHYFYKVVQKTMAVLQRKQSDLNPV